MKFGIYNTISGRLICDPIAYDQQRFTDIISRQGVVADLPAQLTTAHICGPIAVLPGIDQRPAPPADVGYSGQLTQWVADLDNQRLIRSVEYVLQDADTFQSALIDAIGIHKWNVIEAGIVVNGVPVLTAESDRTTLLQTTASVESGRIESVPWKSPGGWIDATAELLAPLRDAVEQHVQACFLREKALHEAIDTALQAEDQHSALLAIDWQSGWPETLTG